MVLANGVLDNLMLFGPDGAAVALPKIWRERPVLFFFMRHFGCAVCRAALLDLREHQAEIRAAGGTLVAVTPESASMTTRYAQTHHLTFPVFSDREHHVYRAFGLREASLAAVSSVDVLLRQAQESLKGNRAYVSLRGASIRLLGGTFIVDQQGNIIFSHIAEPIYNYPPISTYLALFRQLTSPAAVLSHA